MVTNGAMHALYAVFHAIINKSGIYEVSGINIP